MTIVPRYLQIPTSAACRTAMPASSLSVAVPAMQGVTHVGGHMLGGCRVAQAGDAYEAVTSGTHTWRVFRHPNAEFLYVEIQTYVTSTQESGLSVQAGGGTAVAVDLYADSGVHRLVALRVPWDSGDNGWCNFTIAVDGVYIQSVHVWDWPRYELSTSDHAVQGRDATHRRVGLREGDSIAVATDGSPYGVLRALQQSWDDCHRVAATWSSLAGVTFTKAAPDWMNPFGPNNDFAWRHRARSYQDDRQYAHYLAWVWAKVSGGATYSLAFTSAGSEYGSEDAAETGLTNSATAMIEIGPVAVDALGYADLTITGQITSGTGNITIYGVTIGEE